MVTEAIGRNLVNMYMEMVPRTRPIPEPVEPLLPPGYRFHPTDEELVSYYLANKVSDGRFNVSAISEVDLNKCEPWDLPDKAKMGEKEWYFYTLRDRKYPTGLRTNRATEAGYWKATGKDREVMNSRSSCLVGMKKTLVFYKGRAPKGEKTNWIMHEYRLEGDSPLLHLAKASKDEWVVCRIFRKNMGGKKNMPEGLRNLNPYNDIDGQSALPPLLESPHTGGVEEGAGGTDNEPASLQRDPLSFLNKQRPALKQSNDMESWVSRGRITPQYLELPIQYPSLTAMTKSSMALNSLRCYQGNKLFPADLSQELGAQASLLSSATAPTLTAMAPSSMCMQANNVPASTLVLRALIEQYSNPGRQTCKIEPGVRDGTPKLSCKNPTPVTAWTTDSHQQFEPPISASQVQLPAVSHVVNQLAGGISCLADACGEEAQPNVFSRMAKFNTLEHAVNNEMESLWTY